jgi:hypothetical protein
MYTSVAIELVLACPACDGDVPVVRLDDELRCPGCGELLRSPWRNALDVSRRGATFSLLEILPGLAEGARITGKPRGGRLAAEVAPASCPCGAPFTDEALGALSRFRPHLECAACGERSQGRRPADSFVTAYPEACWVVGEIEQADAQPRGAVVRLCAQCGALLGPGKDGGSRCGYCGAVNLGRFPTGHRMFVLFRTR